MGLYGQRHTGTIRSRSGFRPIATRLLMAGSSFLLLAACSGSGLSCEEYGAAVSQILSDMAVESSQAESLIRQGAERDFDEAVSAQLAAEFERLAASTDREAAFDALGPAPEAWSDGSQQIRRAVTLQEQALAGLATAFSVRDAEALGEAALKMSNAFDLLLEIGDDYPSC